MAPDRSSSTPIPHGTPKGPGLIRGKVNWAPFPTRFGTGGAAWRAYGLGIALAGTQTPPRRAKEGDPKAGGRGQLADTPTPKLGPVGSPPPPPPSAVPHGAPVGGVQRDRKLPRGRVPLGKRPPDCCLGRAARRGQWSVPGQGVRPQSLQGPRTGHNQVRGVAGRWRPPPGAAWCPVACQWRAMPLPVCWTRWASIGDGVLFFPCLGPRGAVGGRLWPL